MTCTVPLSMSAILRSVSAGPASFDLSIFVKTRKQYLGESRALASCQLQGFGFERFESICHDSCLR